MEFWVIIAIVVGICGMLGITIGTPLYFVYKKKQIELQRSKIEEEHRTNNLALAYQILSARPKVTMEEVKQLVDMAGKDVGNTTKNHWLEERYLDRKKWSQRGSNP